MVRFSAIGGILIRCRKTAQREPQVRGLSRKRGRDKKIIRRSIFFDLGVLAGKTPRKNGRGSLGEFWVFSAIMRWDSPLENM